MAILNNRNRSPPAWAPVVNNVVAIATLGLFVPVPGDLRPPVRMGTAKLLVLGIGTTWGRRADRGAADRDPAGEDQPARCGASTTG